MCIRDRCPVVGIVEEIAKKYSIPATLLCDTNHVLYSDYSEVIVVGAGAAVSYTHLDVYKRQMFYHNIRDGR